MISTHRFKSFCCCILRYCLTGQVLEETFEPPVVDWLDWVDHWWPGLLVTVMVLLGATVALSPSKTKRKAALKPKRQ